MMRQFVSVEFKRGGRAYSYHNDGPAVVAGDRVVVPSRFGPQAVSVVGVSDEAPPFETKPIVGMARD
jgi:hypothetical protein